MGLKTEEQLYQELYTKYTKIPRSKRTCKVFFQMMREVAGGCVTTVGFVHLMRALTVPNSQLPHYNTDSWKARRVNEYFDVWQIKWQNKTASQALDFVEFPQASWKPEYQDTLDPSPNAEQGHHLFFYVAVGYSIGNPLGMVSNEVADSESRIGQGSSKVNQGDIRLGDLGVKFRQELGQMDYTDKAGLNAWIDRLEKAVCK